MLRFKINQATQAKSDNLASSGRQTRAEPFDLRCFGREPRNICRNPRIQAYDLRESRESRRRHSFLCS